MHKELKELIYKTSEYICCLQKAGIKEVDTFKEEPGLKEFYLQIRNCRKCPLSKTRTNFVFGEGDPMAKLIFVGEAPGYEEDKQGRPFVGRAGQLLTKIIEAIELRRSQVYICNVLKCRPPSNRPPQPNEVEACMPYLAKQLSLLKNKKVICALGLHAATNLLQLKLPMYQMRGKWHEYKGTSVIVTYHPAYLLRNPPDKRKVWADMKKVRECLHR